MERATGFEPADTSLGSWGLTTWRHPHIDEILAQLPRKGQSKQRRHFNPRLTQFTPKSTNWISAP